ncbi:MAG: DUF692 domain-containing protein [Nannocystaceae bacterium]
MHAREITGVGIGLRREHYGEILQCARALDFLEIVPENYLDRGGWPLQVLDGCAQRWPIAVHGVSMSIGGPDAYDPRHLGALRGLLERVGATRYTDHLCYATLGGVAFFDLLPLPWTSAAARHCAERILRLQDALGCAVAVENITDYARMPGATLDEGAFVHEVVERADCGLLLDVANVYVNACNHREDPFALLAALPLARAVQIHLAGSVVEDGRRIDNHGTAVPEPVWAMYRSVIERVGAVPTLIEWDNAIPTLDRVLDEADRARAIQRACAPRPAEVA